MRRRRFITSLACVLCVGMTPELAKSQSGGLHLVGGTTAFVGGDNLDQLEARPVTFAEVSFVAALLRSKDKSLDAASSNFAARRVAVLVRVLAHHARVLGEQPRKGEVALLEESVSLAVGGAQALDALLVRLGLSRQEHANWLEDLALAQAQVTYLAEMSTPPLASIGAQRNTSAESTASTAFALRRLIAAALEDGALRVQP